MSLEALHELVKVLGERIDTHRAELSQSESLTRYALIDPLLRAMGWNTEDPGLVRPEYATNPGSVDYALLKDNRPIMMVEAKKLGHSLQDQSVLRQVINYCTERGTPYFSVTDGQKWEIYETFIESAAVEERRIAQFDLRDDPVYACLQALELRRPKVSQRLLRAGQTPTPAQRQQQMASDREGNGSIQWQPLSRFSREPNTDPPSSIKFPDNSSCAIRYWYELVVHTVRWLWQAGRLNQNAHFRGFLTTSGSQNFNSPTPVRDTPFIYNRHGSADAQINRVRRLLNHARVSLDEVQIRL